MACWLERPGIRRSVLGSRPLQCLRRAIDVLTVLIFLEGEFLMAQTVSGAEFLSIDCGSSVVSYNDSRGIEWVSDDQFIKTGNSFQQIGNPSIVNDDRELESFRYFPNNRSKFCYVIPISDNFSVNFLMRARFYLNTTVLNERMPFEFGVSFQANDWFTVTSPNDSQSDFFITQEVIIHSVSGFGGPAYVCLLPVVGLPFISSLELRAWDPSKEAYVGQSNQYLTLFFRYNLGANSTSPSIRYPDDPFDRIWENPDVSWADSQTVVSRPTAPDESALSIDSNYVPPKVMQDAWVTNKSTNATFSPFFGLNPYGGQVYKPPADAGYVALYVEDLHQPSVTYNVSYYVGAGSLLYLGKFPVSNTSGIVSSSNFRVKSQYLLVELLTTEDEAPLNACEAYGQYDLNLSSAISSDIKVIDVLKRGFSLTDWQGDPCTPVAYDWVSCYGFPTPESPCDSNPLPYLGYNCDNWTLDSPVIGITALTLSDLQNIDINSLVESNLTERMQYLTTISILNSGIDNLFFAFLIQNITNQTSLRSLDFSYNSIMNLPTPLEWSNLYSLESLSLAHNLLAGPLSWVEGPEFVNTLQILNVSYNGLMSVAPIWPNKTSLVVLDLSHNMFNGLISSVDPLVQSSAGTLQQLDVSNNSFTGTFSGDLYFSLHNLTVAEFDGNSIEGTLDLSVWYQKLQNFHRANDSTITFPLFSFVDNNIVDITPKADDFEFAQTLLLSHPGGILLGGNPYCDNPKSYMQGYFCRFQTTDPINYKKSNSKTLIIAVSVSVGLVFLVLCCAIFFTLYKLWNQVYTLRQIQQALAEQKVKPVFFQYSTLKEATRNFHRDMKLGEGGFGDVYKGVLEDKTTILAVKRLFSSKKKKHLTDFLNEVVLISGIKHRNLVQLKGCCIRDRQRMLVYEYVENGNLAQALYGSKPHGDLSWDQRLKICIGVARGLSYLHEELQPSIIHRDIKPENILLDKHLNPKIADFGLARPFMDESKTSTMTGTFAGTCGYLSPEYAQGLISQKLDVFSFGVVILEVISGRKCIEQKLCPERRYLKDWVWRMYKKGLLMVVLQEDLKGIPNVNDVIQTLKIGLLCVQPDPRNRPSMSQVVTMLLGRMQVLPDSSIREEFDFLDLFSNLDREVHSPLNLSRVNEDYSMEISTIDVLPSGPTTPTGESAPTTPNSGESRSVSRIVSNFKSILEMNPLSRE